MSVDTAAQYGIVGFIFMYVAQTACQNPCEWIAPLHRLDDVDQQYVERMQILYMTNLVAENLLALFS